MAGNKDKPFVLAENPGRRLSLGACQQQLDYRTFPGSRYDDDSGSHPR